MKSLPKSDKETEVQRDKVTYKVTQQGSKEASFKPVTRCRVMSLQDHGASGCRSAGLISAGNLPRCQPSCASSSISEAWHSLRNLIQPLTLYILSDLYVLDIVPAKPFSAGVPDLNLRTQKMIRVTVFSILARLEHN